MKLFILNHSDGSFFESNEAEESRLGNGGFGTVFRSQWHGQDAAFKYISLERVPENGYPWKINLKKFKFILTYYDLQPSFSVVEPVLRIKWICKINEFIEERSSSNWRIWKSGFWLKILWKDRLIQTFSETF